MFFLEVVSMVRLLFGIFQQLIEESQLEDSQKLLVEMTMKVVVVLKKLMMESHNRSLR